MAALFRTIFVLLALVAAAYTWVMHTQSGQDMAFNRMMAVFANIEPPAPHDGLSVFMCGTSSPLQMSNQAQSCVAVQAGNNLYIVDAGAGSAYNLNAGGMPMGQLRQVLLTHFHSDHISAIGDFNLASWVAGRTEPLVITGGEGVTQIVAGFNQAYAQDITYRVAHHGAEVLNPELGVMTANTVVPGSILEHDGLTITTFGVEHNPIEPALGYRFDYRGRSVVVSGDTIVSESLITAAQGADLLLHDGLSMPIITGIEAAMRAAGNERRAKIMLDIQDYHAHNADLENMATRANVKQLAVYHLVPTPRNALMANMFRRDLSADTIVTKDQMRFLLPAGSDDINVTTP